MYFVHPKIKLVRNPLLLIRAIFKPSQIEKVKRELNSYFPNKQIIFTPMGRAGFELIIQKYNLSNNELIMPAYICADSFEPLLRKYQIKPILVDIDLKTFNPKISEIKRKINQQTKAILINHTYGLPFDFRELLKLDPRPLIIEDCSHSFGAKLGIKSVGNIGDVSFLSLYKQFPTIKGGILILPQKDAAPKSKLNKISLNLLSASLKKFPQELAKRQELAVHFQKKLEELGFFVQEPKNNIFTYLTALLPEKIIKKRAMLCQLLGKRGVDLARVWHKPIVLSKGAQKEFDINPNQFPNSLKASHSVVNFPLQSYFTKKDIEKIVNNLKTALKQIRA